jgi:very-short-patch-repair endonuclease
VIARFQLLELGFSPNWIAHRIAKGRLHPVARGVYAVGRPDLTPHGDWMAAVLRCRRGAVLSHESAAMLWGLRRVQRRGIEVSVPTAGGRGGAGIKIYRRPTLGAEDTTHHLNIPVTSPVCTIVDLTPRLGDRQLEAVVNEADALDLVDPETLRDELERFAGRPGAPRLRRLLDRHTFTMTDTELERRFLPLAREAGLPEPLTQHHLNGFRVDFYWPHLGLVVETDSLRYHRTPAKQTRDRLRDQAHTAAGLTCLRFTRAQVRFEPEHVERTLRRVAANLR